MAILASDCSGDQNNGDTNNKLRQFSFVFLIELRYVNDNCSLANIIIKQHGMKSKNVSESEIKIHSGGRIWQSSFTLGWI